MKINAAGYTDRGMVREGNEDSFIVSLETGLFAVADGMGGHNAGEVASRMALDVLNDYLIRSARGEEKMLGSRNPDISENANRLVSGIRLANRVIYESARSNPLWRSMGTTIVAALLEGERLNIAHLGDSRAYLVRGSAIIRLTEDHSMVAEQVRLGLISAEAAQASEQRNIITRALGLESEPDVELCDLLLAADDRLLLCSDGLTNMVPDEMICRVVQAGDGPDETCRRLVAEANSNGGRDNVTALVLTVEGGLLARLSRIFDRSRRG